MLCRYRPLLQSPPENHQNPSLCPLPSPLLQLLRIPHLLPHLSPPPSASSHPLPPLSNPSLTSSSLSASPTSLLSSSRSLPNRMLPKLNLLQSLLGSRFAAAAAAAITKSSSLLTTDLRKLLLPKVHTLQPNHVPMPVILKLISMLPRCLLESPTWFSNSITTLKSIGINPQSTIFAHALQVFDKLPESVWQRKLETYNVEPYTALLSLLCPNNLVQEGQVNS